MAPIGVNMRRQLYSANLHASLRSFCSHPPLVHSYAFSPARNAGNDEHQAILLVA
jgi:hypothetical protein